MNDNNEKLLNNLIKIKNNCSKNSNNKFKKLKEYINMNFEFSNYHLNDIEDIYLIYTEKDNSIKSNYHAKIDTFKYNDKTLLFDIYNIKNKNDKFDFKLIKNDEDELFFSFSNMATNYPKKFVLNNYNEKDRIFNFSYTGENVTWDLEIYVKEKNSIYDLTPCIQKAIKETNYEHLKLTRYSIAFAPEYLITVNIYKEIAKLQDTNKISEIFLEWDIENLINKKKISEKIRKGRADICITFDDNNESIIEVKNTFKSSGPKLKSVYDDISRIKDLLEINDTSFKNGYVTFLVLDSNKDLLKTKVIKLIHEMKNDEKFKYLNLYENVEIFKSDESEKNSPYLASIIIKINKFENN